MKSKLQYVILHMLHIDDALILVYVDHTVNRPMSSHVHGIITFLFVEEDYVYKSTTFMSLL